MPINNLKKYLDFFFRSTILQSYNIIKIKHVCKVNTDLFL